MVHFDTECDCFPHGCCLFRFADCELSSVSNESEKYFTIPRSGEMSAAFRAAMFPKRPASTAGLCTVVTWAKVWPPPLNSGLGNCVVSSAWYEDFFCMTFRLKETPPPPHPNISMMGWGCSIVLTTDLTATFPFIPAASKVVTATCLSESANLCLQLQKGLFAATKFHTWLT